jgi:hypothetical protein
MLELAVLEFFRMFVLLVEKKPVENASGECTSKRPKKPKRRVHSDLTRTSPVAKVSEIVSLP